MSKEPAEGTYLIAQERLRQVSQEGWSAEHDDGHANGEMAMAAALYATPRLLLERREFANTVHFVDPWPWDDCWDKREYDDNASVLDNDKLALPNRIRQLVKAGALPAAEIDRLQRLNPPSKGTDHA